MRDVPFYVLSRGALPSFALTHLLLFMETSTAHFRYHVSLRITHPTLEPDLITERLRLQPSGVERKGEPKRQSRFAVSKPDPNAVYECSEWFRLYPPVGDGSLDACLGAAIATLSQHEEFLRSIHNSEGKVHLHVVTYPDSQLETPFDLEKITELRRLGFGFGIDFYPGE